MTLPNKPIKNLKDAYTQNEIYCDKMKEIRKKYHISVRSTHYQAMSKLYALAHNGQITEEQYKRFLRKYVLHMYCQGFIVAHKKLTRQNVTTKDFEPAMKKLKKMAKKVKSINLTKEAPQ